jgi:phytoene dehydrogenase-like protein
MRDWSGLLRYDAAIIGAGADGLAAACLLARTSLRVIVLERHAEPGGRLVTRQFHPGFHASPFTAAPIPDSLFWSLDLARHGAVLAPPLPAAALWPDRIATGGAPVARLLADADRRRALALAHAATREPAPRWNPFVRRARAAWPEENWTHRALADLPADDGEAALLAAIALEGRAGDPLAAGSALNLLAPQDGGVWRGGLGSLGKALAAAAQAAGAELACGLEVSEIRCLKDRAAVLLLADGSEIAARAVISTLDLKRTFLSLFAWSALPKTLVRQVGNFRIAGAGARLLVALAAVPAAKNAPPDLLRRPLHVMPDLRAMVDAHAAWRAGILAEHLPLTLRFEASVDPALAPAGGAVMTVTIGCVPHTPFDGVWTREKRDLLTARALAAIEHVFPGLAASVLAVELLVPPDIEAALGATAGDLSGGEIAPDQMFGFRPHFARENSFERKSPYTPVEGLYLAGPSSAAGPLATGAAGAIAAQALMADFRAGKLA